MKRWLVFIVPLLLPAMAGAEDFWVKTADGKCEIWNDEAPKSGDVLLGPDRAKTAKLQATGC